MIMADIVRQTSNLTLVLEFKDDDDRTISLDNPKASVTAANVLDVEDYFKTNNVFIGDKAGADFLRIKSAKTVSNISTIYDLS